jgi:hypothetical protein
MRSHSPPSQPVCPPAAVLNLRHINCRSLAIKRHGTHVAYLICVGYDHKDVIQIPHDSRRKHMERWGTQVRLAFLPDKDTPGLDVERSLSVGETAGDESEDAPAHAFHKHQTVRSGSQSKIGMRRAFVHCQNKQCGVEAQCSDTLIMSANPNNVDQPGGSRWDRMDLPKPKRRA